MTAQTLTHWIWIGSFFAIGLYFLLFPSVVGNIPRIFAKIDLDEPMRGRVLLAAAHRQAMEGLSPALGTATGSLLIAWAIICAFTAVSLTAAYAVLILVLTAVVGMSYLQLQNVRSKRAATLAVRTPFTAVPAWWYAVALICGLLPLVDAGSQSLRTVAVTVTICTVALTILARQFASAPAFLAGEDTVAEEFVDQRLRLVRGGNALVCATLIVFVYFTQLVRTSGLHLVFSLFVFAMWISLFAVFMNRQRRAPS